MRARARDVDRELGAAAADVEDRERAVAGARRGRAEERYVASSLPSSTRGAMPTRAATSATNAAPSAARRSALVAIASTAVAPDVRTSTTYASSAARVRSRAAGSIVPIAPIPRPARPARIGGDALRAVEHQQARGVRTDREQRADHPASGSRAGPKRPACTKTSPICPEASRRGLRPGPD